MNSVLDYVGVSGDDYLLAEIFVGIGAVETVTGTLPETPISNDPELAEGIWQGQNAKIESEQDYCDQLQKTFKKKQSKINGVRDTFLDIAAEIAGQLAADVIGPAAGAAVTGYTGNPLAGKAAEFVAGITVELGIEWGISFLSELLTRGNELLMGIKEEDEQLLSIEKSRENYEYRENVLTRHRDDIRIVLEQIAGAEKSLQIDKTIETMGLIESLIALQFNGEELRVPGGGYLSLRGKYHGGL